MKEFLLSQAVYITTTLKEVPSTIPKDSIGYHETGGVKKQKQKKQQQKKPLLPFPSLPTATTKTKKKP